MELRDYIKEAFRPDGAEPSTLDWIVAVFAVVIQQNAFVSTPLLLSSADISQVDVRNPYNTLGIAISSVSLAIVCVPWIRQIVFLAWTNRSSFLFVLIVLMSALWSIHPDLTIRRGMGYLLLILVAAYLTLRFNVVDRMKVLSASFAVSAAASVLFIVAYPEYGIMQYADLAGDWRGVFLQKNVFGAAMAAAVFTELFLLIAGNGRPRWRFASLGAYFALVVLSRSESALLLTLLYLAGTGLYLLWQRDRSIGLIISYMAAVFVVAAVILLLIAPDLAFSILGRDTTLTGRTELWSAVVPLIEQRPVLGWGYQAMWQGDDTTSLLVNRLMGWIVPNSHNAFLEITLQLGLVGAGVLIAILIVALRRGLRCCAAGIAPLGWFSLMFFVAAILVGQTETTLGQNQAIEWVIFNVLSLSCGLALASRRVRTVAPARSPFMHPARPVS
jgi:exopolysaccharide production protein ExoQ